MSEVRCLIDASAALGESPVWSAEEQALYWVDILAPSLNRFEPSTGARRSWKMPAPIGSFGLREKGGAIVALRTGFHLFDFAAERLTFIAHPEPGIATNRLNDGKVSPEGRFFAGTMDDEKLSRPLGSLYRLDVDGSCHRVVKDLIVSNGLAWSSDGRTMFHSDSKAKAIWAYDYDTGSGAMSNKRVVATPDESVGRPDGAATDMEGYYWSAGISAGVLNRWSKDGRLDRRIEMPCAAPTMPCFGGRDMKTMFVTSLRAKVAPEKLAAKPLSGGLFALEVDVPGVAVARYKG